MKYLTIIALLLIVIGPAHAYLDGGSGSYIVQMGMAGVLALAFSVKLAWQRIRIGVSRMFQSGSSAGRATNDTR